MPERKLKILQVCSSKSWGGMEMHVVDLSQQLQYRGHEILILTSPNSELAIKSTKTEIPVKVEKFGKYIQPVEIIKLANFIKNNDFDIIHCHYGRDLWTLIPALKLTYKIPLILFKHIGTQKEKKDFLHRKLYKNVDFIVANSQIIYKNILETHPVSIAQVRIIHLGIDTDCFYQNFGWRNSIRNEFGITENEFVIGISGRLQRWKGYYEFLEMAAALRKKYNHIRFMAIGGATAGEEADANEIKKKADQLNLSDRLIFTGYREDVPKLLNALDLFVFPSYAEAYGLSLLEAMAVGLPVIASNCDGVLDIVEDGKTGILIPPRQAEPLIQAAEKLIKEEKYRVKIALNSYQHFKNLFTANQMIEKFENLYYELFEN